MNKFFYAILFFTVAVHFSFATEKTVSSNITSATVYTDRALVTRLAQSDYTMGICTVVLIGLPATLNDESVQIRGEGTAKAKIIDVKVETAFVDTIPQERTRILQDKLDGLWREMRSIDGRAGIINGQKDFIGKISIATQDNISKDLKAQRPTVDDWQKVLKFMDSNLAKYDSELVGIEKHKKELTEKIEAAQRELTQTGATKQKSVKKILVNIDVQSSGNLRLYATYIIPDAGWYPTYDIHVSTDKAIELTYYGNVKQNTGEDWKDIDLTLSTAQPSLGGMQPQLSSWYLNIATPRTYSNSRRGGAVLSQKMEAQTQSMKPDIQEKESEDDKNEVLPVRIITSEVTSDVTSSSFTIQHKSFIPDDNTAHKVTITIANLAGEFNYSAAPKLQSSVFYKSSIVNTTEYQLLAGTMNVFVDNSYIASSQIQNVMPLEKFDAYLGVDNGIKVERKVLNKFTEYGTFSKNTITHYDIVIVIENKKKTPVQLSIQDNVPLSQNEKIEIEIESPKPKELAPDASGILLWNVTLQPGEKKELPLKFTVEYPSDLKIHGLE